MTSIDLSWFDNVGIILKWPSRVIFRNRAAGLLCQYPEVEGIFYPLAVEPGKSELHALSQHFHTIGESLTLSDADVIDGILRRNGHSYIQVDRTKLNDSREAWIFVLISGNEQPQNPVLSAFGNCEGVLIWPNSD